MAEVGNIIEKMARKWHWLSISVVQFDVTNVGGEYSFLEKIENDTRLGENELLKLIFILWRSSNGNNDRLFKCKMEREWKT
ncbi:hypothetical protein [Thomasclavelia sp.]